MIAERGKGSVMENGRKTREQLTNELAEMRQQVAELEAADTERVQAETELLQYTQQLETLQVVTAALSTSLSLDEVLQLILEKLAVVLAYDSAAVFLTEGDNLRCVTSRGHPHPDQVVGQIFPADNELFQEIVVNKQPLYLADAQADSRFQGCVTIQN